MTEEILGRLVSLFWTITIKKSDYSKYVDMCDFASSVAQILGDEKMRKYFERELIGYNGFKRLPEYRIVNHRFLGNIPVTIGLHNLVQKILEADGKIEDHISVNEDGNILKIKYLNYFLFNLKNFVKVYLNSLSKAKSTSLSEEQMVEIKQLEKALSGEGEIL